MHGRVLPRIEDLSAFCLDFYKNCSNESIIDVRRPTFCWKNWFDLCSVPAPIIHPNTAVLVVLMVAIAVLSFIGNSIVLLVFCLYKQLRLVRHYFVVNLAVVDNILVTISIPLFVTYLSGSRYLPLCRSQIALDIICGTASLMTLAAIALERFVAVENPLLYMTKVTPRRVKTALVLTWVYALIVSFIPFHSLVFRPNNACLYFGGQFVIFITVAGFVVPVSVMVFAYWKIYKIAQRHAAHIKLTTPREQDDKKRRHTKMKRELRGAKTLMIIMCTHVLCWFPLFLFYMVDAYCPRCDRKAAVVVNYIILVLRYLNTLANPIIYTGINRQFRAGIITFLLRGRGTQQLNASV